MNYYRNSLILIGMPGSGKSTLGALLTNALKKDLVDTDHLIKQQQHKSPQNILDEQGYLALRAIEEQILLQMQCPNHIVATGGSAVYSENAMHHLKQFGPIIFLDVSLQELLNRVQDMGTRGIARRPDQSFAELFAERRPLYQQYADIVIDCENKTPEAIIKEIIYQEGEGFAEKDA
ncbi:MAG: shikimate kinase [Pseudomonadota bacterium]